jgi:cholesterol transport system auxiliary component
MTNLIPALLRLAAVGALALSLQACVSVLPKQKPAMLYRFNAAPVAAAPAAAGPKVGVLRAGGQFQREAAGDRILTVTGDRVAYIARARWAAPAEVLFDEAVTNAFDSAGGPARLVVRGEPGRADHLLRLDVRNFETHYNGEQPVVLVRVRAVLIASRAPGEPQEKMFEASAPAADNRVGAIVAAYGQAVRQVLNDIVPWVNAAVG